jgi:hypothetical protein
MVFVKFISKDIISCKEVGLDEALQLQQYCKGGKYKIEIIEDLEKIKFIKEFFGEDNFSYSMCYGNCIQNMQLKLHKEIYERKLIKLGIDNKEYAEAISYLLNLSSDSHELHGISNKIDNFMGCIYLAHLKLDQSVSSIIGDYSNVKEFKDFLYDVHPELYTYHNKDLEMEVYQDSRLPGYFITVTNSIIIREINNEYVVCGKFEDDQIVDIEVCDHYVIESYNLKCNKYDKYKNVAKLEFYIK